MLQVSSFVGHTYIKPPDHILRVTCEGFLRDVVDGIFSIHFQSFYASWTVLVHVFFNKTELRVRDGISGDLGGPSPLEMFLLQIIPWHVQRHFAESIDFREVPARSRAP
jgi:hypothetical protein